MLQLVQKDKNMVLDQIYGKYHLTDNDKTEIANKVVNSSSMSNEVKNKIDNYIDTTSKPLIDSYTSQKVEAGKSEIQAKVNTFGDYAQTQARLQALENLKILYFDSNGVLNYKE